MRPKSAANHYGRLAGIPVEGKSPEYLICKKSRIIILIIIIISLGQIYCSKHITHAHTHARIHARAHTRAHACIQTRAHTRAHACAQRTHVHTHSVAAVIVRRTVYRYSVSPNRDGPLRLRQCRSLAIQIATPTGGSSVGRMPDSQSREPGFEPPLLPFRSLGIFVHFTTPQSTQLYK